MTSKKILMCRKALSENDVKQSFFSDDFPLLLKRVYLNRGITHEKDIKTDLSELLSFESLLNIGKAANILAEGIKNQKRFLIIGDFDTDGATSTALAVSALKAFGAQVVNYLIPNRFEYGYGLTPEIVETALQYKPDILITVDNGISSHEGVLRAKKYQMQVVITDHHLPAETLPEADVIINPNQPGDLFPSKVLAGVGVIFYVMLALRHHLKAAHVHMGVFLDLVALGTVADVVPLDKNNRILVHQGLKRMQKGGARAGIQALLQVSGRDPAKLCSSDLGFFIAPRLNAAGRLDDMSLGVACLLSEDVEKSREIAKKLENLNLERRAIQSDMLNDAEVILKDFYPEKIPAAFCLYHPDFHQGVIGILAGQLKERFHRPSIVFAKVNDQELKGSARSIPYSHLRDLLALIDTRHPGLLLKFGGHAMAAGLTISVDNFKKFREIFNDTVEKMTSEEYLKNILLTDGELNAQEFTVACADLLRHHSPWGQGFPEPVFEGKFCVLDQRLINEKHLRLYLKPDNMDFRLEAIVFNYPKLIDEENIKIAYRLESNEYQGSKKLQLVVVHVDR
jgi:single-stranded-DNA-specific exonuclease